jgi:hypothetical protein
MKRALYVNNAEHRINIVLWIRQAFIQGIIFRIKFNSLPVTLFFPHASYLQNLNKMKKSKIFLSFAAILLSMAVVVSSCKKKDDEPKDSDTGSASDNSLAEKSSNDLVLMAGQVSDIAVGDSLSSYRFGDEGILGNSCATITRDSVNKTITLSFSGSTCQDGHTRSGTILIDYSQSASFPTHYRTPGFKCIVTSSNYVVDGNQVNIVNKTIENTTVPGFNPTTTNLTWSIASNISIVKASGGGTVSWTANKVKTLLNTSDTSVYRGQALHIIWSKAIVGITGNAQGTTASGENFTANVTGQLVRDMNCSPNAAHPGHHPFIQGKLDFTPGTKATRYFDYGNGTCDDQATVTIKGVTYNITLP